MLIYIFIYFLSIKKINLNAIFLFLNPKNKMIKGDFVKIKRYHIIFIIQLFIALAIIFYLSIKRIEAIFLILFGLWLMGSAIERILNSKEEN
jgi:hypothetical protein